MRAQRHGKVPAVGEPARVIDTTGIDSFTVCIIVDQGAFFSIVYRRPFPPLGLLAKGIRGVGEMVYTRLTSVKSMPLSNMSWPRSWVSARVNGAMLVKLRVFDCADIDGGGTVVF